MSQSPISSSTLRSSRRPHPGVVRSAAALLGAVFLAFGASASAQALASAAAAPPAYGASHSPPRVGPKANRTPAADAAGTMLLPAYPGGEEALGDALGAVVAYPELAEANGIEGEVVLRVHVDASGRATAREVVESLGYGCDEAAAAAVADLSTWQPARLRGRAFGRDVLVRFAFSR